MLGEIVSLRPPGALETLFLVVESAFRQLSKSMRAHRGISRARPGVSMVRRMVGASNGGSVLGGSEMLRGQDVEMLE